MDFIQEIAEATGASGLTQAYVESAIAAGIAIFIIMFTFFLISLVLKNNGVVDVAWGLGFIFTGIALMLYNQSTNFVHFLLLALLTAWGTRLATHLGIRNWKKPEDFRYKNWRDQWGKNIVWRSFLQVYMLQGAIMFLISIPTIIVMSNLVPPEVMEDTSFIRSDNTFGFAIYILTVVGVLVWLKGFLFETIGDYQLSEFIKRKNASGGNSDEGKIMKTGLWKYTRHPNYFGEAVLWWGIFLIALNFEYGIIAIISPLLIDFLLLKVSGIPMLEKKYEGDEEWEAYKKKTSAFFPLPKKIVFG